jgi:hypothetical protein
VTTDLSALDLATINAVQNSIVSVLRKQCCQWEQDSADAIAENKLTTALTLEQWAFASDLLSRVVATECSALFCQVLDARINWSAEDTRSVNEQLLDALTLELASEQNEPMEILSA